METSPRRKQVFDATEETASLEPEDGDVRASELVGEEETEDTPLDLLQLQPGNHPIGHLLSRLRPNNSIRQDGERHQMHALHRRLHRREPHKKHAIEEKTETLPLVAQVTVDGQGNTLGSGTAIATALPSVPPVPPFPSLPPLTLPVVPTLPQISSSVLPTIQSSAPAPEPSSSADPAPSSESAPLPSDSVSNDPTPSSQTQTAEPQPASSSASATSDSDESTPLPSTPSASSDVPPQNPSSLALSSSTPPVPTTAPDETDTTITPSQSPEPTQTEEASSTVTLPPESTLSSVNGPDSSISTTLVAVITSSTVDFLSASTTLSVPSSITTASTATGGSEVGPGTGGVGQVGGGGAGASNDPSSNDGNSPDSSSGPTTPVLVGGIVGGVAGLAFLLAAILLLLRWRKRKRISEEPPPGIELQRQLPPAPDVNTTVTDPDAIQLAPPPPIVAPGFFQRFRPDSQQTTVSSDTAPSERGFYRVSGRKIAPAIGTGSDGYQGQTLSEAEFGRVDAGPSAGPSTIQPPVIVGPVGTDPDGGAIDEGERVIMRPGAQRTPVTSQGPFSQVPTPRFESPPRRPGPGVDGVGRSHPSRDGSRGSRFTEDVH